MELLKGFQRVCLGRVSGSGKADPQKGPSFQYFLWFAAVGGGRLVSGLGARHGRSVKFLW